MTRRLTLGNPPSRGTVEERLAWLERFASQVVNASHDIDAMQIADAFTVTNLTKDRTYDANSTTLAEIADILGTLLQDMKDRGSKRTST